MENYKNNRITRRDFLKINAGLAIGSMTNRFLNAFSLNNDLLYADTAKRIYIALDDHTDYMWTADEATYRQAFLDMLDYYLDLADATQSNVDEHQSRFNCDGSFWLWTYEKNKSTLEFDRLISRIRDGHISVPLNPLVILYGGVPAEAVLRGMYYPGKIERREDLRFRLAVSMENQTLPYGLGALWAGAGAKYSWKGVCGCASSVPEVGDREHEIYWWQGLDGSRILMKWNSFWDNQFIGGYAEARNPAEVVDFVDRDSNFLARYPYSVIGCFGKGFDDLQTMTNEFVNVAQAKTSPDRLVVVSNEEDFFQDFETNYGTSIPVVSASFGNEWDVYCASMAELSASVKRSVEKLRTAEAMATLVSLKDPDFMNGRAESRDLAWMSLGLYWEHDWTADGPVGRDQRRDWQRRLESDLGTYVDTLYLDAVNALAGMIQKTDDSRCFFAFNPLSWERTDYADLPFNETSPVHVVDLGTGEEVPSQYVLVNGQQYLRILAINMPSMGYKVFEIRPGTGEIFSDAAVLNGNSIENEFYRIEVADHGAITSWVDKFRGNRQLAKAVGARFINDLGSGDGNLQIESNGPVTATLLSSASAPLSHLTRITFIRNSNRIQISNEINENFDGVFTWGFGFELRNPDVWHEEVGAIIRAKLTTEGGHYSPRTARYDWLTLNHFVDISGDDGVGVTLSNADCYFMRLGNSDAATLDTITPQISPLVGGQVDGSGLGIPNQGGDSYFLQRFALQSHDAFDPTDSMKFALEHQNPFAVGEVKGDSGYPANFYSFLAIDNPNVLLWALKPADDGIDAGIVVRLWNISQDKQDFSLSVGGEIRKALNLSHIETPIDAAVIQGGALVDSLNPQQMKTYAIFIESSGVSVVTPMSPSATVTADGVVIATSTVPVNIATPSPIPTAEATPAPDGKGCLLGLFGVLFGMSK